MLTCIICLLSTGSAIALSGVTAYTNISDHELNASIAILCSTISICLSCCRAGIHRSFVDLSKKEQDIQYGLVYVLMIGALSDAMFDIIQGLALYFGQSYTLTATILGATEAGLDTCLQLMQQAKILIVFKGCPSIVIGFVTICTFFEISTQFIWQHIIILF